MRIVVDFPAPFGPRKPVTVPGRTLNVRSETAVVGPYRLVSSWISIMKSTLPNGRVSVIGAPSLPRLGKTPPVRQERPIVAGRKPLYRDLMTWRAIKNALAGLLAGLAGGVLLGALIVIWGVTLFTLATGTDDWEHVAVYVGIVLLIMALTPWLVHGLSAMQRSRLRVTLGAEIPAPVRPLGRTWHQLGYHLLAVPAGLAGGLLAVLFPVAPWLARWFTETDEGLARALLGPGRRESLAQRVETLARSRADVVAAADAERRRIERDLHDGAQQRLVSLAMNLGMARERFESEPEPVRQALAAAHDEAVLALTELREFIRGLHPAVLNDRGLDAALSGLAARAPLPVRLRVDVAEARRARRRGGGLLHRLRGDSQRGQARPGHPGRGDRDPVRRPAPHHRHRRRPRRRHACRGRRHRFARPGPAGRRGGWHAEHRQPARRAHHHHRGAAMRIVIAEDSVLLRDGLTRMLTDGGFEVVAAVPDAAQLLKAVAEHRPELAVIDVRMPPTHTDEGIKAALVIRRQFPDVALLVLSQYVEESYATDLLSEASSSVGYLLKDRVAHVRDFLDALRRVAAGGTALDPEVVAQLLVRRRDDPLDRLTPREQQVLKLMAEGRSNTGIMETLKVSPSAVEKYVTNIFLKLDLPPTTTDHRRVLAVLKYLGS